MMADEKLPSRFWSKILLNEKTGCWEWTATCSESGYARFRWNGKSVKAHRVSYEILVGSIPTDMVLDHLCRVRHCVNPKHLEVVTRRENTLRGNSRSAIGIRTNKCINNHEYTKENTYNNPGGFRECKTCKRINNKKYYLARQQ